MTAAPFNAQRVREAIARVRAAEERRREASELLEEATSDAKELLLDLWGEGRGQVPTITGEQLDDAVEAVFELCATGVIKGIARCRARYLLHRFLVGQLLLGSANRTLQAAHKSASQFT
jgi:7-keto-8-aminopelargonate synthetase-like enzyme